MRATKTILILTLALTISALLGMTRNRAASRVTENLSELLKLAGAAAEVTVTTQHVQAENASSVPFTVVSLKVEKVYKGTLEAGSEIQAEYMGGAAFGRTVVCPGQPQLKAGDRAVVLLMQVPGVANWRILAGDAGQIVLDRDGTGREIARRASGRFEFYVSDEASLTGYRQVKSTSIYSTQLNDLLQAIVNTGRPVLEKSAVQASVELPAAMPANANDLSVPSADAATVSFTARLFAILAATTLVWAASRFLLRQQRRATLQ